jgi:hypothetical protein
VSWFDSFDTYPTGTVNLYDVYPKSVMLAPFLPRLEQATVTISANGRRGGKALVANMKNAAYGTYLTRGIVGPTTGREPYVRIGMAVYLTAGSSFNTGDDTGQRLFALRVAAQRRESAFVTYYEIDDVIQAYIDGISWSPANVPDGKQVDGNIDAIPYRKDALVVGVGSDGFLRVSLGDRSDTSGVGTAPLIVRSTKQMPFNQWCHLEFSLYMGAPMANDGFLYGWIDGEMAMQVENQNLSVEANYDNIFYRARTNPALESLLNGPRVASGANLYNADNGGYIEFRLYPYDVGGTNLIDDLYVLHDQSIAPDEPLGDLVAIPLPVTADGASQDSVIGGTSPAATHWQSVETNDGDVTRIEMVPDDSDLYVHDALDSGLTVKALRVVARAKKSGAGAGAITLSAANTDGTVEADPQNVLSTTEYVTLGDTFERDPLGAEWTPATVNDAELGITRAL